MFRVKPRATLGLIFFTVLIQNSDKQWKVLSGCLKKLPSGIPSGHQTFPRGCAPPESMMTLGKFFQTTTEDFPLFFQTFGLKQ